MTSNSSSSSSDPAGNEPGAVAKIATATLDATSAVVDGTIMLTKQAVYPVKEGILKINDKVKDWFFPSPSSPSQRGLQDPSVVPTFVGEGVPDLEPERKK